MDTPLFKFKFSKKRFKVNDLLRLEAAASEPNTVLVDLMSKCMVGADGEYVEKPKALAYIGDLDWEQYEALCAAFNQGMTEFQAGAIPPTTGVN